MAVSDAGYMRTGFDESAPLNIVDADTRGARHVSAAQVTRFQLTLGSPAVGGDERYEGYVVANGVLRICQRAQFLGPQGR